MLVVIEESESNKKSVRNEKNPLQFYDAGGILYSLSKNIPFTKGPVFITNAKSGIQAALLASILVVWYQR